MLPLWSCRVSLLFGQEVLIPGKWATRYERWDSLHIVQQFASEVAESLRTTETPLC